MDMFNTPTRTITCRLEQNENIVNNADGGSTRRVREYLATLTDPNSVGMNQSGLIEDGLSA